MSFLYKSIYLDKPIITNRALDIFVPKNISQDISLVFIHGGGWKGGTRQQMHKLMEGFCNEGFICSSFDYRLDVDGFSQLTDLRNAYDYFVSFLKGKKHPLKIVTYGSSAGAHLNALISLASPGECGEKIEFNGISCENDWIRPIGCIFQAIPVLFELWEDIFPPSWECFQRVANVSWEEHPEVYKKLAPIEYIDERIQEVFFMNASNEHMFPVFYVEQAAEKIRSYNQKCISKTYLNAEHGFFYDLTRKVQKEAFTDMLDFLRNIKELK